MSRRTKRQSRTTSATGVSIPSKVQTGIIRVIESRMDRYEWTTQRARLEAVDKLMQLEVDNKLRPARKTHGYAEDTMPPIIKPEIETAHAFFADMFCSGEPMFKVVENNKNAEAAKMMQAQVTSDQMHYGHGQEVSKFLRDMLKYNVGGLEVSWDREEVFQPMNDLTFSTSANAKATTALYAGNRIKRIDPYNMFVDKSVPANELAVKGSFVGYVERLPMTQLHEYMASLTAVGVPVLNDNRKMWESRPTSTRHYVPTILANSGNSGEDSGWGSFFFPDDMEVLTTNKHHNVSYSEHYEVTTVYMRIIPSMFNMSVTAAQRVQIWKFVIVNGQHMILAERQTNAHNKLPVLTGQLDDEGIWSDSKSMAEMLIPYQNQSTQMNDAYLGMIWKAVGDKGIYDSRRINKRDIDSKNPQAKIPARPNANNSDLRGAYLPMPYDSGAAGVVANGMNTVRQYASQTTGQNDASKGQFQKGNKTMREFTEVMGNSDSRRYVQAITLESIVFQPMKNMMKYNILQFAQSGELAVQGEAVTINPADMRKAMLDFRIADGLKNVERIAKTGELAQGIQLMAPYAQLAPAYGIDPFMMILDYLRNMGLDVKNYDPQNLNTALLPRGGSANAPTNEDPAAPNQQAGANEGAA